MSLVGEKWLDIFPTHLGRDQSPGRLRLVRCRRYGTQGWMKLQMQLEKRVGMTWVMVQGPPVSPARKNLRFGRNKDLVLPSRSGGRARVKRREFVRATVKSWRNFGCQNSVEKNEKKTGEKRGGWVYQRGASLCSEGGGACRIPDDRVHRCWKKVGRGRRVGRNGAVC